MEKKGEVDVSKRVWLVTTKVPSDETRILNLA